MEAVSWEQVAVTGFVLAVLAGSVVLLRADRRMETVVMLVGSAALLLGHGIILASLLFWDPSIIFDSSSPASGSYMFVLQAGNILVFGGLVVFGFGFVKFSLLHGPVVRRAEDLEVVTRGLQQRMEEQE